MAKTGRPRKEDGDAGTKQIRVFDDLGEMIADLSEVLPKSTAQICDPLLRPEITKLCEKYKPQITAIKAAKKAAEEAIKKAQHEVKQLDSGAAKKRPGS